MLTRRTWYIAFLSCDFTQDEAHHTCSTIQSVFFLEEDDHSLVFLTKVDVCSLLSHTPVVHHVGVQYQRLKPQTPNHWDSSPVACGGLKPCACQLCRDEASSHSVNRKLFASWLLYCALFRCGYLRAHLLLLFLLIIKGMILQRCCLVQSYASM
jgi:hypothetical protein